MTKTTGPGLAAVNELIDRFIGADPVLVAPKTGATVPAPSGEVEQEIASAGTEQTAA